MKKILIALAFLASTGWASPTVSASQASVADGPVMVFPVPAGVVGETLVVFVATEDRVGNKDAEAWNPGWSAKTTGIAPYGLLRLVKVSDGSEASVTVNMAGNGAAIALRVSGAGSVQQHEIRAHGTAGVLSDPPTAYTRSGVQDSLVIAVTANAQGVALIPAGYGFPVNAAGAINLTVSFRSVVASSENPGPYSLNVAETSTAASALVY